MFPQVQPTRYPNSSLPTRFFEQTHIISPNIEFIVPLPVMVSANCKHACIYILLHDKFASIYISSNIVNYRTLFKDIHAAMLLLIQRRVPISFNNLVTLLSYTASDDVYMPPGTISFNVDEKSIFYRFVLETYVASMFDFILYLYHHNAVSALLDIRIVEVNATSLIIKFDQGIL